jgi:hypothetical protein
MLRDFSYELGKFIPASPTPCCIEGADIARRLFILGLITQVSMFPRATTVEHVHSLYDFTEANRQVQNC